MKIERNEILLVLVFTYYYDLKKKNRSLSFLTNEIVHVMFRFEIRFRTWYDHSVFNGTSLCVHNVQFEYNITISATSRVAAAATYIHTSHRRRHSLTHHGTSGVAYIISTTITIILKKKKKSGAQYKYSAVSPTRPRSESARDDIIPRNLWSIYIHKRALHRDNNNKKKHIIII